MPSGRPHQAPGRQSLGLLAPGLCRRHRPAAGARTGPPGRPCWAIAPRARAAWPCLCLALPSAQPAGRGGSRAMCSLGCCGAASSCSSGAARACCWLKGLTCTAARRAGPLCVHLHQMLTRGGAPGGAKNAGAAQPAALLPAAGLRTAPRQLAACFGCPTHSCSTRTRLAGPQLCSSQGSDARTAADLTLSYELLRELVGVPGAILPSTGAAAGSRCCGCLGVQVCQREHLHHAGLRRCNIQQAGAVTWTCPAAPADGLGHDCSAARLDPEDRTIPVMPNCVGAWRTWQVAGPRSAPALSPRLCCWAAGLANRPPGGAGGQGSTSSLSSAGTRRSAFAAAPAQHQASRSGLS